MPPVARPGAALREYRRRKGWTLAYVSGRTGIPISTLSRIENDQISPTYGQLSRLSEGLSIDIASLLSRAPSADPVIKAQRRSVNRLGQGETLEMPGQVLKYLSADLLNKQFSPILGEIKARSVEENGEFLSHPGEEFVYVVEGTLELHTDAYAPLTLQAGESVYFDCTMPHGYVAKGDGPCRVLSVCSAPHDLAGTGSDFRTHPLRVVADAEEAGEPPEQISQAG